METITLYAPHALLMVLGLKRIETRSWQTRHRGPLAIHTALDWPADYRAVMQQPVFRDALAALDLHAIEDKLGFSHNFPLGRIVGKVHLDAVIPVEQFLQDERWAWLRTEAELEYGNYGPGRYCWITSQAFRLPNPVSYRGNRMIWQLPNDYARMIGLTS